MKIEKFENLDIWKRAREICKIINQIIHDGSFSKDYKLKNQIQSSSGSIMDNT